LLAADAATDMRIANSIWTRKGFSVLPTFYEINRMYYNAEVSELDFNSPQAAPTINGWCDKNTGGKIDKIIDYIDSSVVMYLINAIYFKGSWVSRFDKNKSEEGNFTSPGGAIRRETYMKQTATFDYYADESVQAARFPYGNDAFGMMVVIPRTGTVNEMIENLTPEKWAGISRMYGRELRVEMPRMKLECEYSLVPSLKNMGLGIAFTDGAANFKGINPDAQLCISDVIHKTYIAVDEEGTEAAAVTSVIIVDTSYNPGPTEPIPFLMNKPFLLAITEKSTGAILFIGAYK